MKLLKITFGLILAAALLAVAASPTMAAPRWVHCVAAEPGHYGSSSCTTAGTGWETKALVGTSEVTGSYEISYADEKAGTEVTCKGRVLGWVANLTTGPGEGGIYKVTATSCKLIPGKEGSCEEPVTVLARNLPWGERLEEPGGEIRNEIISGPNTEEGAGQPGWSVECEVAGILKIIADTCEISSNTQSVIALRTTGAMLFDFDARSAESNCTVGGEKTGRQSGSLTLVLRKLTALWVLAAALRT